MQACAFDPITSFGILARPRVCLTIVTLGLPWVPWLSPKENGHLPCFNTLLAVLLLKLLSPVVLSTHSLHHEWFVVFNGINLLAESVPSN